MSDSSLEVAERHRRFADCFATVARNVEDWAAPAPVAGWTARDVVDHLTGWFLHFLASGGVDLAPAPADSHDPVATWLHHAAAVQQLLETRGEEEFTHPHAGTHRLADAVDRFYSADVFMHTWDLARAGGVHVELDEDYARQLLEGMRPIEEMLRSSGQYGAAVPVPDDAPVVDQLMGFVGRDPEFSPAR
ncbi:TIGR03086 family metal-binding protein [Nocardioides piscis]|uniref:TIGR03086 family protein n=1 Tax=Nocardioides piscis TaxID=2714938 RepID=A0A6G7YF46_9ACTN|nr:TIGR03086 family metal-binding protein [Nocardioides piscis]QIK75413.1 TIGR03086 family protein [Nocardioides piscis]